MSGVLFNPYLNFDGNTREAMEFYQGVFGGNLALSTFAEFKGMPCPPGYETKIMHARLDAPDVTIMASEGRPGEKVNFGDNFSLSLSGTDNARLTGYFDALAAGGQVLQPIVDAGWGDAFGMLSDRFGTRWLVNISKA